MHHHHGARRDIEYRRAPLGGAPPRKAILGNPGWGVVLEGVVLPSVRILAALLLVALNALFVAAEFAFVKIRATQVDRLVEEGKPAANMVQTATSKLDAYLAVCQLGITISSLGIGALAEPTIATLVDPLLASLGVPGAFVHPIAIGIALFIASFFHVTFGELVPKTLSVQKAEGVSLFVAPFMRFFYYLLLPFTIAFNGTANAFTSMFGIPPASEGEETYNEDEIRTLIARSARQGELEADEGEMIGAVFELGDTIAREVMVPRPDVITLQAEMPLSKVMSIAAEENYTRYPVLDLESGEQIVGAVHVKDVLRAVESEGSLTASDLAREVLIVPENRRIDDILTDFQRQEIHMAVVIDEWGAFEGVVTIEDIIEEIVGEIRDEFDVEDPEVAKLEGGNYSVEGRAPIQTVNEALDAEFESEDFDTIGGLVLGQLGRAPEEGDEVVLDGYTLTVDEVDGTRISHLIVRESAEAEEDRAEG